MANRWLSRAIFAALTGTGLASCTMLSGVGDLEVEDGTSPATTRGDGAIDAAARGDALTVGDAPGQPGDALAPRTDGGNGDAGDAGTPVDASHPPDDAQTGSDVVVTPLTFCKSAPSIFCDDFDDGAAFGAHWDSAPPHGRLITTTFTSSPRSYELAFPDQNVDGVEYLAKSFTVPDGQSLRVELAMRVTDNAALYPFAIFFPGDRRIMLNLDGYVNEALGSNQNAGYPYKRPPADGTWRRYTFNVERAANSVELLIDGAVALKKTSLKNTGVLASGTIKLAMGLYYAPPNTPWTGAYDDVRVTSY